MEITDIDTFQVAKKCHVCGKQTSRAVEYGGVVWLAECEGCEEPAAPQS